VRGRTPFCRYRSQYALMVRSIPPGRDGKIPRGRRMPLFLSIQKHRGQSMNKFNAVGDNAIRLILGLICVMSQPITPCGWDRSYANIIQHGRGSASHPLPSRLFHWPYPCLKRPAMAVAPFKLGSISWQRYSFSWPENVPNISNKIARTFSVFAWMAWLA